MPMPSSVMATVSVSPFTNPAATTMCPPASVQWMALPTTLPSA